MFTWPQIITKCRDEAMFPRPPFPTDSQWMSYISKALQTLYLFVHKWAPRALPVGTHVFSTIANQQTYTLPQDFAAVLEHPEWRETSTASRQIILPTYPHHPMIYVARKDSYDGASFTKYEIWRHATLPDRYQIALYPYPQSATAGTVGANTVQLDYARRPLEQFFGYTSAVTSTTLTVGLPQSTFGTVVRVADYYKNTLLFAFAATSNAFQYNVVSAFDPVSQVFTFATSWAGGAPTGTVGYMTAPQVVELWQKALIAQACTYALQKDENSTGMLGVMKQNLADAYAELQYYLEVQYPKGPRTPRSVDELGQ